MKNKTLWKQVGAAAIAAAMVMSTVPATPVQAAGGKTLAVSSQKQLNQALKTVKGKNAVITVKAGKNVKITIPKGTYKVTIRVVGKQAAVINNGTVKEIVVNSKGTVAIKNNGTIKKVTVQNAKRVSFSGNCKKAVPVVVNAEDVSMILAAPAKITAKKDVNIVLKKGAEKSSITCTKNAQAQVDNQTKKAISVKIADGTTLKVESGESCTITPKGKKEDTSGEDKTDEKEFYNCELIMEYENYKVSAEFESTGIKKLIRLFPFLKEMVEGEIVFIDEFVDCFRSSPPR